MCGIAGEFAFGREQVTAVASRMIATLRHRGPDSSGHYVSPAKNGGGEGGGGGAREKGASGVLGMSLLSWRNRRPRPAILFTGGLPGAFQRSGAGKGERGQCRVTRTTR